MKKLIMGLVALVVVFVQFTQARVLLVPGTASWYADRYYNTVYGYDNRYCDTYYDCNHDYLYRDKYQYKYDDYQYKYDHAQTYMPRLSYHQDRYRDDRYDTYKYTDDRKYVYDTYQKKDGYRYDDDTYDYRYRDDRTPLLSNIPTYIPYTHDNAYYETTPDKTKVVRLDYYYDRYGNPYIMKYDY
ncbi:MAG: hypothetical protein WC004_00840 [Candidatus Absconditabacterales bacterium]